MSTFEQAIPTILRHEGLLEINEKDPGGITNYGISLRFLEALKIQTGHLPGHLDHPGDVTEADIKNMSVEDATQIYKYQFWYRYRYGEITDQRVATKIFDMSVNLGATRAAMITQECVNSLSPGRVKVDGILGTNSIQALNQCAPATLWALLMRKQADFYTALYYSNRDQYAPFIKGWLDRAYDKA